MISRGDVVVGDQTVRVTPDEPRPLGGGGLAEDWLFMYGREGDESWYTVLGRATTGELAGCYTLRSQAVFDDGSHLIFVTGTFFLLNDEGLRLPKGATLVLPSPDPDTGVYPFPGASYCIEADGTVSGSNLPS